MIPRPPLFLTITAIAASLCAVAWGLGVLFVCLLKVRELAMLPIALGLNLLPFAFLIAEYESVNRRSLFHTRVVMVASIIFAAFVLLTLYLGDPNTRPGFNANFASSVVIAAALLANAFSHYRWAQTLLRFATPHLCPTCSYDLRATPTRCPECGHIPQRANTPTS